jgi:hypothetical protein
VNSSNSFACCSAVMPMPLSATASSIQSRPSTTLRARSATSPCLVNLQALLMGHSRLGPRNRDRQRLARGHSEHTNCREIFAKCREGDVTTWLKAIRSQ